MRTRALVIVLLALPVAARGETVGFTYSFKVDSDSNSTVSGPGPIYLDPQVTGGGSGFRINDGRDIVTFGVKSGTGTAGMPLFSGGVSGDIALGHASFGPGPGGAAFKFGFTTKFTGTVHIKDGGSGASADVPVTLAFSGVVSSRGDSYAYSVTGPALPGVTIGKHFYSLQFPSTPVSMGGTDLKATVVVDAGKKPGPVPTPEPSSLLLGGLGLLTLGRVVWQKRRPQ
jgi:hypothetical protein